MSFQLRNPIMLALDLDDESQAMRFASELGPQLGAIKLGPRLVQKMGSSWTQEIAKKAPLFIDNKFYDIPSTMVSAVRASFQAGASFTTVHAMAGGRALADLAQLEAELNQIRPFKVLCVSILTSYSDETLPGVLKGQSISSLVTSLVRDVVNSGLTGIVCSPQELALLKSQNLYKVVPGIRGPGDSADDQSRTLSAAEALRLGASALVIGRPILQASHPELKLAEILATL